MNFLNNERLMHHIQNIINCLGYKNWGFTALVFSIFLFFSSISNAQDIVYIEYFMNSDPGLGNATELSIVSSPDLQNQTFTVDISELDVGFHSLYIRSKDENGLWSLTNCYTFYKQNFHESLVEIEYAEYFFNNDPGLGNGVSIPLTPGSQISNATFSASINELNSGFNHLFVRAKSSIGEWSLTNIQAFYKDIIPLSVSNIVKAEYYFNTDPGLGNGVNIPITPDQQIDGISFVADITGLDVGFHSLFLRAMNENLKWSHTNVSSFYLDYIPVVGQSIIAAEYFLDDDPGYGNGTSIPIVSSPLVENSQFSVDMSDLGNGFHNLYVRALRSDGRWSHTNLITFYKDVLDATVTEVIAAEYFIDTDPGLGNGSPIDIVPGQDIDVFVNVSLLNLETQGENRLYIRTKDSNGKWSHTNIIVFTIDKLITLNANPVNGGEVEGAGWYDYGYELTVVATPNEGFNFLNWTENGEQVSDMASYSFVVEDHRDLVAHFSMIDFQLTLLASPEASGILMGEGLYNLDDEVLIQATPVAGWRFLSWNMGEELISEAASFTYTMPAENVALTAHFEAIPMYSLTLTVSPADAGTVSGAGDYEEGAQVPITATASAGYQFVSWNMGEEVISEASSFTYTMPAEDVTLTAHFEAIPMYSLTLTVSPADAGTVSGAGDYQEGEQVPITATASAGYQFVNWNMGEEVISEASSFTYTMPAEDVTLTAVFNTEEPTYLVTFSVLYPDNSNIIGAVITIDDIYELVTDENGASIELPGGSYGYIVRYLDFSPQEGEFIVQDQDVSIVIFFPFSDYSITFNVVNQVQEAIEGAKISIEGIEEELYTDHNGHGTIELYFGHYTFSVSANEYQIYNGEFIAFQQQEFSVNVEMIPVSVESHYFLNLQVYPNPFSNTITILNSSGIRSVFITNLIGQKVMDIELSGGELETIQTEGLVKGIYLITFQAENGERLVRKMVKE